MKPLWKQVFDAVEQAAAPVMSDATASSGFAEVMKVGLKISRDMSKQAEELSRRALHAVNLPAAGDLAYLKTQIGSLEAEVRTLRRALEAAAAASPAVAEPAVAEPKTQPTTEPNAPKRTKASE